MSDKQDSPQEIAAQKAAVEARKKARLAKQSTEGNAETQKAAVAARKKERLAKQSAESAKEREAQVEAVRRERGIKVAERKQQAAVDKAMNESKTRMAKASAEKEAAAKAAAEKAAAEKAAAEAMRAYTVKSGDTLGAIAQAMLGNANRYNEIFEANKDVLSSPSAIYPGQELKIPAE